MAMHVPKAPGIPSMMKDGARYLQGNEEAVYNSIENCIDLGKMVRTTFGPSGMNKMVINHIGKLFVTNDAEQILAELEVAHPAAKLLVLAAKQQNQEAGDGTNLIIILASALLDGAAELLKLGLSVTEVAEGYELGCTKALEILKTLTVDEVKNLRDEISVSSIIRPVIMSKQFGNDEVLSNLIAKACISTMPEKDYFNVDHVRVCKVIGSGVIRSSVISGMAFKRHVEGDVTEGNECKVVVYSCPVDTLQTETKGTIRITTGEELKAFSAGEESLMEKHIKDIVNTGCKVVVSGGKIGDLALHYCNKYGLLVVRLNSKFDVRRICQVTGATALPRLTAPSKEELGYVNSVKCEEIGGTHVVVFKRSRKEGAISTIILRGSTDNILDNAETAIDDGVNTFKSLTKNAKLVAGAGACEMELSKQLHQLADRAPGMEQYSLKKFAQAFETIPRALAENYGLKASEIISKLGAVHQAGQKGAGLVVDAEGATIKDAVEAKILDLYNVKFWAIKFATAAACTILRVDKIIMAKPAGGPKPKENQDWDED
jgi:T-complex protein 1 subunit theta